jgi:tRNA pseudouridine55 synthase
VFTGKSTKKIDEVQGLTKVYTGTFTLGATTPSFDLESEPVNHTSLEEISDEAIIEASKQFIGEIQQVPPIFSALKIDGKKAYDMAREGTEFEMEARTVTIHDFKITNIQLPEASFEVECSKGTYIRSLAHDFGKALGCGAYLSSLCRTRIGNFSLEDAITLEQLEALVVLEKENEQPG